MNEKQTILAISKTDLSNKVQEMFHNGYRLVQIGCTALQTHTELNYSFDKHYEFINFKLKITDLKDIIPSISNIYWHAFLYENEIHDLFHVLFDKIAIDYKGNFYRTKVKYPFSVPNSVETTEKGKKK